MKEEYITMKSSPDYLDQVFERLEKKDFIKLRFENFIDYFPYYDGGEKIDKESIVFLSEQFEKQSLESEPRIRQGIMNHNIISPIFVYRNVGSCDYHSLSYRNAFLMVRMGVIMAKVDGVADDQEILKIKNLIWNMRNLSIMEKSSLYVKANYFIDAENETDGRTRNYIRIALNRDALIEKLPELSQSASNAILKVAKDIAIADGFLERGELRLLQDIYKCLGMSARSTKPDLERYAAEKYIGLQAQKKNDLMSKVELDEIDDLLGDLLLDFDGF